MKHKMHQSNTTGNSCIINIHFSHKDDFQILRRHEDKKYTYNIDNTDKNPQKCIPQM